MTDLKRRNLVAAIATAPFAAPLGVAAMAPDVLQAQDAQPMSEVKLGSANTTGPEAAAFDGTNVWIATQFNDSVTRIRATDGAITGTFTVGKRPVAVVYAAGAVWVANLLGDTVTKLNPATGEITGDLRGR
jgi:DNA-binding beta-propeller fold protein YncE